MKTCEWVPSCHSEGDNLIVCGCLNYHLAESYYCHAHYKAWTFGFNTSEWLCSTCSEKIEEYLPRKLQPIYDDPPVIFTQQGPIPLSKFPSVNWPLNYSPWNKHSPKKTP